MSISGDVQIPVRPVSYFSQEIRFSKSESVNLFNFYTPSDITNKNHHYIIFIEFTIIIMSNIFIKTITTLFHK